MAPKVSAGRSVGRCGGRRRLGGSVAERNRSSTEPVAAEVAAAADDDDNNDDGFGIRVARCGGAGNGVAPATLTRRIVSGARS